MCVCVCVRARLKAPHVINCSREAKLYAGALVGGKKRMKHKIYKCMCDVFKSFIFFCYYYLLLNRNKN